MSFVDSMKAAADFIGTGAIETNRYESEIVDIVRRNSVTLSRTPRVLATGHPTRYFEQLAVAGGSFSDPRAITTSVSGPTRVERAAYIKAIVGQSNLSLFDVDVTRQQGQFAAIEAKDVQDIATGVVLTSAKAFWTGTDTSLIEPTTVQYVGALTQITQQSTVAPGASIIDGIKAQVAAMVANTTFVVKPTAIYVNPILGDYIDREAKAAKIELGTVNIAAGVTVNSINTQAGVLPLIPDPFLASWSGSSYGFGSPPSGNNTYAAVIVSEDMIEMPVIAGADGNLNPRLFQLGLVGDLQAKYIAVQFDALVCKGASYAHAVVGVQRP